MNEGLLPSRYAKALFLFAGERHIESDVYDAMRQIAKVFESEQGQAFRQAVGNPFMSENDKRALILAAAGIEDSASPVASAINDFLSLLFKNNRIDELRGIVNAYDSIYRKEKNISRVHVTWASEPTQANEQRLRDMIEKRLGDGTMEYTSSVDSSLIGGFKVAIDNEQLDASVENELRQLSQKILSK